jgi:integrase
MSVFKRKGRKTYEYKFQIKGHPFYGNTGERTRPAAALVETRLKKEARALIEAGKSTELTLDVAIGDYWQKKAQYAADRDNILKRLARLQKTIGPNVAVKNIDLKMVDDYVAIRRAQKNSKYKDQRNAPFVSHGEVNKDLTYLSAVLAHAQRSGATVQYIDWNKAKLILPESPMYVLSVKEERRILDELVPHAIPMIEFMFLVGQRKLNCWQLDWSQISFEKREITFFVKSKKPGGRKVVLPINNAMHDFLILLNPKASGPVFTFGQNGCSCWYCKKQPGQAIKTIRKTFDGAVRRAGINRKVRFHDIRHTTATRLLMLSKDIRLVQQYLGHSDIKSTLHYAEHNTAEKHRGMDLLSEIGDKNGDTRRKKAANG